MSGDQPRVVRRGTIDWVKFDRDLARDGSVEPVIKCLYAAVASFADPQERDTSGCYEDDIPTRKRLAECIGRSVKTVDRAIVKMEEMGLLEVERMRDPENPKMNIPSVYYLLDYQRWEDKAAERAAARKAERDLRNKKTPATGYDGDGTWRHIDGKRPRGGDMGVARGGDTGDATPNADETGQSGGGWGHGCRQGGDMGVAHSFSASYRDLPQEGGLGETDSSSTDAPGAPSAREGEDASLTHKQAPPSSRKPSVPAQERRGGDGVGEKPSPSVSRPPEDSGEVRGHRGEPAPSEGVLTARREVAERPGDSGRGSGSSGSSQDGTGPSEGSEELAAASRLLSSLEGPLSLGKRQVAELAPLLTEVAAAENWPVGAELKAHLTKTRNGSPVKDAKRVLRYRIENLPPYQGRSRARVEVEPQPGEEMCERHPKTPLAACTCSLRSASDMEEIEGPVDVEAVKAKLRADMEEVRKLAASSAQKHSKKAHSGRT